MWKWKWRWENQLSSTVFWFQCGVTKVCILPSAVYLACPAKELTWYIIRLAMDDLSGRPVLCCMWSLFSSPLHDICDIHRLVSDSLVLLTSALHVNSLNRQTAERVVNKWQALWVVYYAVRGWRTPLHTCITQPSHIVNPCRTCIVGLLKVYVAETVPWISCKFVC